MEQRRSRPAAAEPERTRILHPLAMWGLLAVVIAALVLLFPRTSLREQVVRETQNDPLSLNYVENLLRANPRDVELRVLLVNKKIAAGAVEQAHELLEPLKSSDDPAIRRQALMFEYRLLERQTYAAPANGSSRAMGLAAMRLSLRAIEAEYWEVDELVYLARSAVAIGERQAGALLFRRLLQSPRPVPVEQLAALAAGALGLSEYEAAAALYFTAQRRLRGAPIGERRELYLKGVAALQSGNLLDKALAEAERNLGDLGDDEQTLAFLTRLALAAGRPALAQQYVKRMLHMSAAPSFPAFDWLSWLISNAHAAGALRPYDEALYTLAYEVFLANTNLADAARVARSALDQTGLPAWREKLAQVSEWNGKPREALEHWLVLARSTHSDAAVNAVLRLAPGLFDYDALIYAWNEVLAKRRLTAAEWRDLAGNYELAGRPQEAIALMSERAAREPAVLEPLAGAYERSGRPDEAIRTYERLLAGRTPSVAESVRLASLYFVRADFAGAWRILSPLQERATDADTNYWRALAELAWMMQEDAAATRSYQRLIAGKSAESGDAERLVQLLRPKAPEEAARVAGASWRRLPNLSLLIVAMEIYAGLGDTAAQKRLLDDLSAAEKVALERDVTFLAARARYHEAGGNRAATLADYRAAAAIAPHNAELRLALIYLIMEAGESRELRRTLALYAREANADAAYWDAYAAAWVSLGDTRRALGFLARQAPNRAGDYLWLLNYADVLDDDGQGGMAWRVRRHAWDLARGQRAAAPAVAPGTPADRERMRARARLVLQFAPGDAGLAIMRSLLRQGESASGNAPLDAGVSELALAWAISTGQDEAAKAWLWTRYGKRLAAPAYAEVSVALAQNDTDTLERLIAEKADKLPRYSRIDAARATQQLRLAQEMGFAEQEKRPDDDEIHLRLTTDLLKSASSVIAEDKLVQRGVLKGREERLAAQVWLTPRLRIAPEIIVFRQASQDGSQLTGVPGTDRRASLSALYRHPDNAETTASVIQRSAFSDFSGWRLTHRRAFGNRLSGDFVLAKKDYATESVPLSVAGHRDIATAGLNFNLSMREYLRGRLFEARYHTQQDTYVGSGRGYAWEAGYRIRTEYPDWTVRLTQINQRFTQSETSDAKSAQLVPGGTVPPGGFFVPASARTYALSAGFGDYYRENYSRALRPFADFSRSANSVSGNGYNWIIGAGGSVAGHDYLSLYLTRGKGGPGAGDATREFGLRYQYFFDRF